MNIISSYRDLNKNEYNKRFPKEFNNYIIFKLNLKT